jgi:hypothetical protein
MKTKLILTTLILCILFSCKKKSEDVPATQNTYCSKLTQAGYGTETWNYDAQNKLSTFVFTSANENINPSYTYKVLKFTSNGSIEEAMYDFVSPAKTDTKIINSFTTDGKVSKRDIYNFQTGNLLNMQIAEYTTNTIKVSFRSIAGNLISWNTYNLTADGKNLMDNKNYDNNGTNVPTYSFAFMDYDAKKNYESLYPVGYSIYPIRTNNSLKDVLTQGNITTVYNYNCEYNADGFITKRTNIASGSFTTYEYIKR